MRQLGVGVTSVTGPLGRAREMAKEVCGFYEIPIRVMFGPHRHRLASHPRSVAMWLARKKFELSYPDLGMIFKRDHSTVIASIRKINDIYKGGGWAKDQIKKLEILLDVQPGLVVIAADNKRRSEPLTRTVTVPGSISYRKT